MIISMVDGWECQDLFLFVVVCCCFCRFSRIVRRVRQFPDSRIIKKSIHTSSYRPCHGWSCHNFPFVPAVVFACRHGRNIAGFAGGRSRLIFFSFGQFSRIVM